MISRSCALRPHEVGSSLNKYLLPEGNDLYTADQGPFSKMGLLAKNNGALFSSDHFHKDVQGKLSSQFWLQKLNLAR